MTESCHTLLGLVEIVPHDSSAQHFSSIASDDGTLHSWFEQAAEGHSANKPTSAGQPIICRSDRWHVESVASGSSIVRADLSQLLVDLEREYQQALRRHTHG